MSDEVFAGQDANQAFIGSIVKYLFMAIVAVIFFLFVARPLVNWVTGDVSEIVGNFIPKTLEEFEKIQTNIKSAATGMSGVGPNTDKVDGNMLKEKIVSLVNSNPAKVAQIVREMMNARKQKGKFTT